MASCVAFNHFIFIKVLVMHIGCPKEIKPQEHRVGLVPSSVAALVAAGHTVAIETMAGAGIGFSDADYRAVGATVVPDARTIFATADLIIKVKEPQESEYTSLHEGQVLFTYLHLAPDPQQAQGLIKSRAVAIAYETVTGADGRSLPLLTPMSEVAGRLSAQVMAEHLMKHKGGMGRLMGGVTGVEPAHILVLGGGVAGRNAALIAAGMQARVTILERATDRLAALASEFAPFGDRVRVATSDTDTIATLLPQVDGVIGAVLLPGASAPRLVTRAQLAAMRPGAVLVDISIDQGGCFETSHATTHADPTYVVDGIVHYCVANMPGAVPLTSALALNQAVLPYTLRLAGQGWRAALAADPGFMAGLNVAYGHITHAAVATALGQPYVEPQTVLQAN
jgi:alanine dehydrogenase